MQWDAHSRSGAETLPTINDDFIIKPDGIQNAVVSAYQQDEAREQKMVGCCCRYKYRYNTSL